MDQLTPGDILGAVAAAAEAMRGSVGADWTIGARDLDWTCRRTLNHSIDAVLWYATNLATTSTENSGDVRDGKKDETPVPELLRALELSGYLLARVVEASPPGARGWHDAGMADATGFLAMGCDETLVHTFDVCAALGVPFAPPADICDRTVRRLFPWARSTTTPGSACSGATAGSTCRTTRASVPTGAGGALHWTSGTARRARMAVSATDLPTAHSAP